MTTNDNPLEELIVLLENARADYDKFLERGNNAAGTRVRKAMQEVKSLAQELRVDIQEAKNTR